MSESIRYISNGAIKRLAQKAGVKRLSGLVYEETRGVLLIMLEEIIGKAIYITEFRKAKTLSGEDVREAIEIAGDDIAIREFNKTKTTYRNDSGNTKRTTNSKVVGKLPTTQKVRSTQSPKQRRFKPGTVALANIRYYQKNSYKGFIFPIATFDRLVREIALQYKESIRLSEEAVRLVQYYIEDNLIEVFKDANIAAIHARRQTVQPKDIQIVRRISE